MPFQRGDLLIYINKEWGDGKGSLAIAISDEYDDESCTGSCRGIDVDWITGHPSVVEHTDFNVTCFEKIGHIEIIENNS